MKKTIFLLMIGAVVALSSCSKSDKAQSENQIATFQIDVPVQTRADVSGLSRYIVEAYEGENLSSVPIRVESSVGSLTLALKKNTKYTFLFWADNGTAKSESVASSGYYNTDKLQEVAVSTGSENSVGVVAYCLAKSFNSSDFDANKSVALKNATAKVQFTESAGLIKDANSFKVKYPNSNKLNVADGKITATATEITHTYANVGKTAKDAVMATDYILSSKGEQQVLNIKVQLNDETEREIANVPFQQCFITNIKGEYSSLGSFTFTVSADDTWDSPSNDVTF